MLPVAACLFLLVSVASAQQVNCSELEQKLNRLRDDYSHKREEAQNKAADDKPENSDVEVDFDIESKLQHFSFDVPQFQMKSRDVSFSVPEFSVRQSKVSWSTPSTRMVEKQIGTRPTITCHGFHCRTRMKPIYTKVPEFFMDKHEIVTSLPNTSSRRASLTVVVPEVPAKQRVKLAVDVPNKTGDASVPVDNGPNGKAQRELQKTLDVLNAQEQKEAAPLVLALFQCHQSELDSKRKELEVTYASSISQLDERISFFRKQSVDPAHVPADGGEVNLVQQMTDLIGARDAMRTEFDEASKSFADSQRRTLRMVGVEPDSIS